MAGYIKKVIYLSYMRSGSKVKSAGFVKIEKSGGICKMDMHISGLGHLAERQYEIKAVTFGEEAKIIGRIFLHMGCGEWQGEIKEKDMAYDGIQKLLLEITGYETVEGAVNSEVRTAVKEKEQSEKPEKLEKPENPQKAEKPEKLQKTEKLLRLERPLKPVKNIFSRQELKAAVKTEKPVEEAKEAAFDEIKLEKVILSDKWEQLQQLYPIVHPYEDDREYISIKPKDFVIMTGDYQHLANNSFLLHGFYNYRHIILGREQDEEKGGDFYLGVPGVYYEREKMVALMFGFEAFECSGGKAEPGKFGYYLKKVKI